MNVDNNSDQNESLEAPEDDDFGDFEGAEDEAPEAVQAMIGGPNWVYPDLVRIQSSSNSNTQNDSSNSDHNSFNNQNRISHRILDPPDVSLLTNASGLNPSKPQQTLDLCSSLGSSSNATKLIFNTTNSYVTNNNKSGGPTSVSSPSSGSSSSSLAATNMSGLILSNSSNSSSPSLSNNNIICNNNNVNNPIPSTSNGITASSVLGITHLSQMEHRIRTLQVEKRLLQEQLCERDKQINDLQRMVHHSSGGFSNNHENKLLEDSFGRRIETSLERIETNLETSINDLVNRVERLENKVANISSSFINGGVVNNGDSPHRNCLQLFQQLKLEQQQERRETTRILSNILSHALQEINSLQ